MNLYFIDGLLVTSIGIGSILKSNCIETTINTINNVYLLNIVERLFLYHFCQFLSLDFIGLFFVIPHFQNWLIGTIHSKYQEEKIKLVKFIISKKIIRYFQGLFHISNYQIFKVYSVLSIDFFIKILQNTLFIFIVYLLKQSETTYMYYRIIKYHSFISSYYNFSITNTQQATDILHDMILESRWSGLADIEIIHALFVLFHRWLTQNLLHHPANINIWIRLQFVYFKIWIPYYIHTLFSYLDLGTSMCLFLLFKFKFGYDTSRYIIAILVSNSSLALVIIYCYDTLVSLLKDVSFYFTYKKEIDKVISIQNQKESNTQN